MNMLDAQHRIDQYLQFITQYPHLTDNSQSQLPVISDRGILLREQQRLYQMADE
jgi:hypothetical protein